MAQSAQYQFTTASRGEDASARRPRVSVGLVNNMPDAALQATERQFVTLLHAAAESCDIRIHLFSLPGVPRAGAALERLRTRYIDYSELRNLHMDALIVTGAVPVTSRVEDEPFWKPFCELVDWAADHTVSTIWSCLAAHAAVQHIDGIERHRLPSKLSGVFDVDLCSSDPLVSGLARRYNVPHSRYNGLNENELVANGYVVLGRSTEAGVDMFSKRMPSRFVFLQGHPEYDGDTLMREYRRDLSQFLAGERAECPDMPAGYLSAALKERLNSIVETAAKGRDSAAVKRLLDLDGRMPAVGSWSPHAIALVRSWIDEIARDKSGAARRSVAA